MAINWSIVKLECTPSISEDIKDAIKIIHWRAELVDEEYTAQCYGSVILPDPEDNYSFIPFNDVTEEEVISWLLTSLGENITNVNTALLTDIENQKNPPIISKPLPWI